MPLQTPAVKLACPITIDAFSLVNGRLESKHAVVADIGHVQAYHASRSTTIPLGLHMPLLEAEVPFGKTVS